MGLHTDGKPSELIAYTGPTLTATREKHLMRVLPWRLSLGEPPERRKLTHNDCSESAYRVFSLTTTWVS